MNEFSLSVFKKVIRKDYQEQLYYTTAKLKKHLLGASFLPAELVKFTTPFTTPQRKCIRIYENKEN